MVGVIALTLIPTVDAQVILSVDVERSHTGGALFDTQAGFQSFDTTGVGSAVISQTFGAFTVDFVAGSSIASFSGTPDSVMATRYRANHIANSGSFTQSDLMNDRLNSDAVGLIDPATGNGTGTGLYMRISGLSANTQYSLQVWGVDHTGNPGSLKNGYAYGFDATNEAPSYTSLTQLGTYTISGNPTTIADNDAHSITGNITTDGSGTLIYKSISNMDGSGIVSGFQLSAVPEPSTAILLLGGIVALVAARRRNV